MFRIVLTLLLMAGIYTAMRGVDEPRPVTPDISGVAYVIDGDTFTVGGIKIRLFGIDAPEMEQNCKMPDGEIWACGRWSRDEVRRIVKGRDLRCVKQDTDKYGRIVARCYLGTQDLAQKLARDGIVFSYAQYSRDYIAPEREAAVAKRGIWRATFISPRDFRRQKREN